MTDQFIVLAHSPLDANGASDRDRTDWSIHHGKDAYGWAVHRARSLQAQGYQYVAIRTVGDIHTHADRTGTLVLAGQEEA